MCSPRKSDENFSISIFVWIKTNVAYTRLEVIAKQRSALQVEFITGVKLICYFVLCYCFLHWAHLPNMAVGDLAFYCLAWSSSERDYVITDSVRSMCMYVCGNFCKIDHCIHIHWCIPMGLGKNDPWVESHLWPQQMWGQRSSRGQWPLVQVLAKRFTVSTYFVVFS